MSVGTKIKYYRRDRGLTQQQLSDLVGKSLRTISKYEMGETHPPMPVLMNIANALGVSTLQLLEKEKVKVQFDTSCINIKPPTRYTLDMDKINTVEDIKVVLKALNINVYDNCNGFKELKQYLKEC